MDETKPNDTFDRSIRRSLDLYRLEYGETQNIGATVVDSYKVVHTQEPVWVCHLRMSAIDSDDTVFIRVVLRPEDPIFTGVRARVIAGRFTIRGEGTDK